MHVYDYLWRQRNDLVRKKLVPEHTMRFFTPQATKTAVIDWQNETLKEKTCPICGITLRAPSIWMSQHTKIHAIKARDSEKVKEDEPFNVDARVNFD